MMNKRALTEDLMNMEKIMERTANRTDIWQDRFIYAIALAIWHLLQDKRRGDEK